MVHIRSSEIAVILSNSCLCLKQSQTLHQAKKKKKMSSSFYPSTCMVYVCLNCVADSQGPSWSQITVDSFHAKIQGLITEGHCIVVPDNRAVRTAGIYHPFTLCRRMKQPGMQPRWRNQPGGVCGRDTMFDLCSNRESSAQN